MGSLSPRTRNAQVELFQSGEVDFLVATDAIGMGLNMDVDHVAFAGLRKFDGRRTRGLYSQEIGQIAGRAGRFRKDGAFGVTGDAPDLDPDIVGGGRGPCVSAGRWPPSGATPGSISRRCRASCARSPRPPPIAGLAALRGSPGRDDAAPALDRRDRRSPRPRPRQSAGGCGRPARRPDFRKTTQEEHTRLIGALFAHLTQGDRRMPEDWMQGQFATLDRADGDIDALSMRLARVRTLAYIANRADWLADPLAWQGRARDLEDRLSDTLHQSLMQRFVDRRTSTLLRSLNQHAGPILGGIGADGAVTVEGHVVGRLSGVHFEPERGASALENRALRGAVERAVAPEIARGSANSRAKATRPSRCKSGGLVAWRGLAAGEIVGGGPVQAARAAPRRFRRGRLSASAPPGGSRPFVAGEASRRLSVLKRLTEAIADGTLKGPRARRRLSARRAIRHPRPAAGGRAYPRAEPARAAGPEGARRALRRLLALSARSADPEAQAIGAVFAELAAPRWRPAAEGLGGSAASRPAARGAEPAGPCAPSPGLAAPVLALERLDALRGPHLSAQGRRTDAGPAGGSRLESRPGRTDPARAGLRRASARPIRREPSLWRRRSLAPRAARRRAPAAGRPRPPRRSRARRPRGLPPDARAAGGRAAAPRAAATAGLSEAGETCRVDVWLWRARFFKTRSLAARIVEAGGVRLMRGGARTPLDKPSRSRALRRRPCLRPRAALAGGQGRGARRAPRARRPRRGGSIASWMSRAAGRVSRPSFAAGARRLICCAEFATRRGPEAARAPALFRVKRGPIAEISAPLCSSRKLPTA